MKGQDEPYDVTRIFIMFTGNDTMVETRRANARGIQVSTEPRPRWKQDTLNATIVNFNQR